MSILVVRGEVNNNIIATGDCRMFAKKVQCYRESYRERVTERVIYKESYI